MVKFILKNFEGNLYIAEHRNTKTFHCINYAFGDTQREVEWFYSHLWRSISKEDAADKHLIAIG